MENRLDFSEQIADILPALVKAQSEFTPVLKTSKNPFFHSMYAPLENVFESVKAALLSNGILVFQDVVGDELRTRLVHTTGQWIAGYYPFSKGKTVKVKDKEGQLKEIQETVDSQTIGGAHTYARRYALLGMLMIAAEDDDGEVTADRPPQRTQESKTPPKAKEQPPDGKRKQSDPEIAFWSLSKKLGDDKVAHELIKAVTKKDSAKDVTVDEWTALNGKVLTVITAIHAAVSKLGDIKFDDLVRFIRGQVPAWTWGFAVQQLQEHEKKGTYESFANSVTKWLAEHSTEPFI